MDRAHRPLQRAHATCLKRLPRFAILAIVSAAHPARHRVGENALELAPRMSATRERLTPVVPADFALSAASSAIKAGTAVPVFSDFFRLERPQGGAFDLGAAERP